MSNEEVNRPADHQPRFNDRGWLRPNYMSVWEEKVYRARFKAGYLSYQQHYGAALHGNCISVARMEQFMQDLAVARLRGRT